MAFDFGNLKVDREQIKTSSKTGGFNFGSLEERQNSVLSDRERIRAKMEQDKIDEQQRIAEQQRFDTQNQAIEAQGGFINGIKSFFGKGKALPTIENELPQYTQARIETQPKTFGQNVKNLLTENTANSIYDIFYQQGVDEQSAKTIESNINAIRQLVEKNKLEQDESVRTKRLKTIGLIQKSTEEIAGEAGGDIAKKTTAQLVGQSLGTALELTPFLGFKSAGTQAIKLGTKELTKQGLSQIGKGTGKQLTKDIITESALFGGATGFGEGLKQKDATAGDVFKSTAEGALAGGALAGGIVGLGKLGGKVTQKLTPRKLEFGELVPIKNKIEAQTGELKPSQILEVKTAIEKGHSEDEIVKAFQETGELTPKIDVPEPPIRTTKPVEPVKVEKPIHTPKESPLHLEAKKYSTPEEFVKAHSYNRWSRIIDKIDEIEVSDNYDRVYRSIDDIDEKINDLESDKLNVSTYKDRLDENGTFTAKDSDFEYESIEEFEYDLNSEIKSLKQAKEEFVKMKTKIEESAIAEWIDTNSSWLGRKKGIIEDAISNNRDTGGTAWEALLRSSNAEEASELLRAIEVSSKRHRDTLYDSISKRGIDDDSVSKIRKEMNEGLLDDELVPDNITILTDIWKQAQGGKKSIGEIAKENIGKIKEGKKIKQRVLNEMADFTEYAVGELNLGKLAINAEIRARKIAEKLGINPDVDNKELAKKFGKILEKLNWSRK